MKVPCKDCGRKFKEDNIEKHEAICKQIFCQTRRKFDAKKKRVLDSEHAVLLKKKEMEEKQKNNMKAKNNNKDKWKKSSEEFRAMVKMGTTGEGFGSILFLFFFYLIFFFKILVEKLVKRISRLILLYKL